MSEPWNQPSFEQLLNDDSLVFDEASWLTDAIDWDVQYPPAPEEPIQDQQDPAHQAEKKSPPWFPRELIQMAVAPDDDESNALAAPTPQSSGHSQAASPDQIFNTLAQASSSTLRKDLPAKQKLFACKEPQCKARYARKGDLARHRREEHSDEEYYCPYSHCLRHRKGHGFKRMHRLVSHLLKPSKTAWDHPHVLSRLDAKYIAVDFNDGLLTQNMLWASNQMRDSSEEEAVVLDRIGRRCTELAKYVNRLKGVHCPQAGCCAFLLSCVEDICNLRRHLCEEHEFDWDKTGAFAREAIAAQKDTA